MANAMLKQIMKDANFSLDLFDESITYNGEAIRAIVQIGDSDASQKLAFSRNGLQVLAGNGFITVSVDDVPKPKRQDVVVYNDRTFYVAGVEHVDSVGGSVTVRVVERERGLAHL